jgi:hypothetical protein
MKVSIARRSTRGVPLLTAAVLCSALAFASCASESSSSLAPSSTGSSTRTAASAATGGDNNEPGETQPGATQPGATEPGEGGAEQKVEGTVTGETGACPNISFSIGSTRVNANQSTTYTGTSCTTLGQNSQSVEVKGTTQSDGSLLATEIEVENGQEAPGDNDQPGETDPGQNGAEQKVEGPATGKTGACPNISFSIGGTLVVANQATTYSGTSCSAVGQNGQSVEVKGTTQSDGSLLAREIEVGG